MGDEALTFGQQLNPYLCCGKVRELLPNGRFPTFTQFSFLLYSNVWEVAKAFGEHLSLTDSNGKNAQPGKHCCKLCCLWLPQKGSILTDHFLGRNVKTADGTAYEGKLSRHTQKTAAAVAAAPPHSQDAPTLLVWEPWLGGFKHAAAMPQHQVSTLTGTPWL